MKDYIENMVAMLTKELNYVVANIPLDNEEVIIEYANLVGRREAYTDILAKL